MGIFSTIMNKIFHHDAAPAAAAAPAPEADAAAAAAAAPAAVAAPVDVGAVLAQMVDAKGGDGGNYETSIVDLLKLLDMDSSLSARKELADELDCHEGDDGTAEENIALHKAVMDKLAENGGHIPDNLKH